IDEDSTRCSGLRRRRPTLPGRRMPSAPAPTPFTAGARTDAERGSRHLMKENDMPTTPAVDLLAEKLTGATAELDANGQEIGLNLLRLLALGDPVSPASVAERVGVPESRIVAALDRWPGVFRDEQGRVIGYAGLTVVEMGQHRIHVDGRAVSTWCAYDTLFLPELLGQTVGVT